WPRRNATTPCVSGAGTPVARPFGLGQGGHFRSKKGVTHLRLGITHPGDVGQSGDGYFLHSHLHPSAVPCLRTTRALRRKSLGPGPPPKGTGAAHTRGRSPSG